MTNTDALVEAIAHRLTAQRKDFYQSGVWVALLKLLTHGQPVAISQLAEAADLSPDAVAKIVSCCGDLEVDGQNQIVGMGLTLNPTPHQFQLNGHALYTWCALDTLMYVAALGQAQVVVVLGKVLRAECVDCQLIHAAAETATVVVNPDVLGSASIGHKRRVGLTEWSLGGELRQTVRGFRDHQLLPDGKCQANGNWQIGSLIGGLGAFLVHGQR